MAQSISVRVKNKSTGDEGTLTYKAFLDVQSMFILIGQIDESGNLIDGDPNLQPQHQRKAPVKSAAVASVEPKQPQVINVKMEVPVEIHVETKPEIAEPIIEEPRKKRPYNKRVTQTA